MTELLTSAETRRSTALPGQVGTVLEARGLSKGFGGDPIFRDVDFSLRPGEVVLLQGANGSGKTTLLNMLTGFLEPDSGTIRYSTRGATAEFTFPQKWGARLSQPFTPERVANLSTGRTWQDVRLFPTQSLRDNLAIAANPQYGEGPLSALFSLRQKAEQRALSDLVDEQLARLGLKGREGSSADMISLGQSKRVAIARALIGGARILFLDEPLAGLDRDGINAVVSMLETLIKTTGLTIVIVEHVFNHRFLRDLCTTEWILDGCTLRTRAVQSQPKDERAEEEWTSHFISKGAHVTRDVLIGGASITRISRTDAQPDPNLEIVGLQVERSGRKIFTSPSEGGLNLTLNRNEVAILRAPNGWGKSSLLGAIAGLLESKGDIRLNGSSIAHLPTWGRSQAGVSYLSSNRPYFEHLTDRDNFRMYGAPAPSDSAPRPLSRLSGGQRQRLAIKAFVASRKRHEAILLDEPFIGLDHTAAANACAAFLEFSAGRSCLITVPQS